MAVAAEYEPDKVGVMTVPVEAVPVGPAVGPGLVQLYLGSHQSAGGPQAGQVAVAMYSGRPAVHEAHGPAVKAPQLTEELEEAVDGGVAVVNVVLDVVELLDGVVVVFEVTGSVVGAVGYAEVHTPV